MTAKERIRLGLRFDFLRLELTGKVEHYGRDYIPIGTVACEILNLPEDAVQRLGAYQDAIERLVQSYHDGHVFYTEAESARQACAGIVALLYALPPFSRADRDNMGELLRIGLDAKSLRKAMHSRDALETKIQTYCLIGQLSTAVRQFREAVFPLVEQIEKDETARTPEGYARIFGEYFNFEKEDCRLAWMSGTNVSILYAERDGALNRIMYYPSFPSLFRGDLFEGLAVGHAPRKCPVCGKYFLTLDAKNQRYCDGYAPDDPKHRTCRQVGNLKGREFRERAENHPLKKIYARRMDSIRQAVHRGSLDLKTAEMMKLLAKDKLDRAIADRRYAEREYEAEMEQSALLAEAELRKERSA